MPVVFYHMKGCGFCQKAKDELANEIASGKVVIKDSKEAPTGVRGFPHFVNEDNGKSVTGFKPAALLMKELGVVGAGPMPATRRPMPKPMPRSPMPKPMPKPMPRGSPMPMPRGGSPMPQMGGMPMIIAFFFMPGCGHCEKCKTMLSNEISQGLVQLVPHTKAPKHVRGFPHFIGPNGAEHSGAPRTKEELMGKLLNGGGMPMPTPMPMPMPMPMPNGGMPMPMPMPEQPLLREGYVRVPRERYGPPQNQMPQGGMLGNARAAGSNHYNHPRYQHHARAAMHSVGHHHGHM
jgi:glutaredoxin